ncbi:MAG: hypothetical protein ACK52I_31120 [Pseudomonadota bacterium]
MSLQGSGRPPSWTPTAFSSRSTRPMQVETIGVGARGFRAPASRATASPRAASRPGAG